MALARWVGRAIGLDVHRDFCVEAICDDGKVRSAGGVPSTPDGLRTLAESLLPSDRVALEVTGSCWEVARILEPYVGGVAELGLGAGERAVPAGVPDPELVAQAKRRSFTAKYKARILAEADACTRPGEVGELLRREGLYTSHLTYWRKQRKDGALKELGKPRGRKPVDRRDQARS